MDYNVIAIAGLPGSGKSTLLGELKKIPALSGWHVTSAGALLRERHAQLRESKKFNGDFMAYLDNLSDDEIIVLNQKARELAIQGNLILDSRYAIANCKNMKHALLVFLHAPINVRIARQKKVHPKSADDEIKKDLETREQWEFERGIRLYGYDYRNKSLYNFLLDTSRQSVSDEARAIANLLGVQEAIA